MTQFCALFLLIYALLAPQRGGGGAWHYGSPLNTPLRLSIACSTTKHGYADGLSRLPLLAFPENHEDYAECFYFK